MLYYSNDNLIKNRKRNLIPNYKVKLKIICRPHRNALYIDKYLFWITFLIMEKTTFVVFGLISSLNNIVLKKKFIMELL